MNIDTLSNLALFIIVISWMMRIIGIPPVRYWRKERRVEALSRVLAPALDDLADDDGQIQGDPYTVAVELALALDNRVTAW